jgi:hypothetical protein
MKRFALLAIVAVGLAAAPANASIIFQDNFDAENGGKGTLNFVKFSQWTVTKGTVDLIGQKTAWDFFPGQGLYLDMDGSGKDSGGITWNESRVLGPGAYTISFKLGGSQRWDGNNTVRMELSDLFFEDFTFGVKDGLTQITRSFFVKEEMKTLLSFTSLDKRDNMGLILDDVMLASEKKDDESTDITEPATLALIATALILIAGLRRREGARALS